MKASQATGGLERSDKCVRVQLVDVFSTANIQSTDATSCQKCFCSLLFVSPLVFFGCEPGIQGQ